MRTLLLFASLAFVSTGLYAQDDIPTEVVGDEGTVNFSYQGTPVTYVTVRSADGHVWLQQNLGASQVADSSTGIGEAAYGDLYQWGRWTDGHQVRTSITAQASTLAQNDPTGLGGGSPFFYIGASPTDWWSAGSGTDTWMGETTSSTNGIDPCSAIGEGWVLPTQEDWTNIMTLEGVTGYPTAYSSNLKLAVAGSRDGQSGILINVGSFGNYWASTPNDIYAKNLTIGPDFVNPIDDGLRSYGMSVRCLNKDLHVGITGPKAEPRASIFPNPTLGTFTITAGSAPIQRIALYTMDMRLLHVYASGTRTITLDASFVDGLYWLSIDTANGTERHKLLLKR
jgi:hypothetical protein